MIAPRIGARAAAGFAVMAAIAFPAGAQSHWSRTFGGPAGGEIVHAVRELPSGDIVVAASTDSFGTMTGDAWLIRMDSDGNVLSQAVVGHPLPGGVDGAVVLSDGGAVFASRNVRDIFTAYDASIVRVAPDGSPLWVTEISGGDGRFFVNDLVALGTGSFLGVGQASTSDAGPFLGWLVLLDASGNVTWQQVHGGVLGEDLGFEAAVQASDGGFALTGGMTSASGGEDVLVVKTTSTGSISWAQRVGGSSADRGAAIVEVRGGGGYAVAGWTDSFTTSGHSGWVVRLDMTGALTWTEAVGNGEWSDLQAIALTSDNNLVVLGRVGFATNDQWAAKIHQGAATILWQRAYEGVSGDHASEVTELSGGDLLLAGTWAWGFPEEDLWLLRTDADGRIAGCGLVSETFLTNSPPRYTRTAPMLPPVPPFGTPGTGSVVTATSALSTTTQCGSAGCPALRCDAVTVDPDPACEGVSEQLTLLTSGGSGLVSVRWDLDGDTLPESSGNPVSATFPPGTTTTRAFAEDDCLPTPSTCELPAEVTVLSSTPPGEVSDVRAGAVPLLVLDRGARLSFEERADAAAYNLYADAIGSWYFPSAAAGSACFVATTPGTAGRLEAAASLAAGSWVVVTASSRCAEGLPGRDSLGTQRISVGAWSTCGPAP